MLGTAFLDYNHIKAGAHSIAIITHYNHIALQISIDHSTSYSIDTNTNNIPS